METSDYDEISLCKALYFVRGTGLLAELNIHGGAIDQKMVVVHGSPCAPTPLTLMLIMKGMELTWQNCGFFY
jgi:hypothetical protein